MTIVLVGISSDMQAQSSLEDRISSVLLHQGSEGECQYPLQPLRVRRKGYSVTKHLYELQAGRLRTDLISVCSVILFDSFYQD
jgi:hypothetical protein